jgi:hypothetical protein
MFSLGELVKRNSRCSRHVAASMQGWFDWAKFRRTKGAIKLHLLLDHDGYLPSFAVVVSP